MNSLTLPSFWKAYETLDKDVQKRAQKAFRLWKQNPFHPSLRFKCVNREANIWSLRVTRGYRALGVLENDTIVWFWIGNHDDYDRLLSK